MKVDLVNNNCLVDRRANSGVCGEDARIICHNPDRKADMRVIDNYEISSIPLVTERYVTNSLIRYVIIITHQHAYYGKGKTVY